VRRLAADGVLDLERLSLQPFEAGVRVAMDGRHARQWELLRVDAIAEALPSMRPPLDVRQPVRLSDTLFVAGDHRDTASQQGALASGARAAAAVVRQLAPRSAP
jgi:hypothetical protein